MNDQRVGFRTLAERHRYMYLLRDKYVLKQIENLCLKTNDLTYIDVLGIYNNMKIHVLQNNELAKEYTRKIYELGGDPEDDDYDLPNVYGLPYKHLVLTGDGGSGKTNMIGLMQSMRGVTFVCSTNEAGGNLERNLNRTSLFYKDSKTNLRHTFCKLFGTNVEEMDWFYKAIYEDHRVSEKFKGTAHFENISDYWKAHKHGFLAMADHIWERRYADGPCSPDVFRAVRDKLQKQRQYEEPGKLYDDVIEVLQTKWKTMVPIQLMTTTYCIDEAGRIPYYYVMFMVFFHHYVHVKFATGINTYRMPAVVNVGSPTQSRVVHDKANVNVHVSYSPLTIINKHFFTIADDRMYVKLFKYNRRVTDGDIQAMTVLAHVVEKLESGSSIGDDLYKQFSDLFVIGGSELFFKPDVTDTTPRLFMSKRWNDLKKVYAYLAEKKADKMIVIPEYLTSEFNHHQAPEVLNNVMNDIDVKMKGEKYDGPKSEYKLDRSLKYVEPWDYAEMCKKRNKPQEITIVDSNGTAADKEEDAYISQIVYKTFRSVIVGSMFQLTHVVSMNIIRVIGTIGNFLTCTRSLLHIIDDDEGLLQLFYSCLATCIRTINDTLFEEVEMKLAMRMLAENEEILASLMTEEENGAAKDANVERKMGALSQMVHQNVQTLASLLNADSTLADLTFLFLPPLVNVKITFQKDSNRLFKLTNYNKGATTSKNGYVKINDSVDLIYGNCLELCMYRKVLKRNCELKDFNKRGKKRETDERSERFTTASKKPKYDIEEDFFCDNDDGEDYDMVSTKTIAENSRKNVDDSVQKKKVVDHPKSFIRFFPLVASDCSTIDNKQGSTVSTPILGYVRRNEETQDMITLFTRHDNPKNLHLVTDQPIHFKRLDSETTNVVKFINRTQHTRYGWI